MKKPTHARCRYTMGGFEMQEVVKEGEWSHHKEFGLFLPHSYNRPSITSEIRIFPRIIRLGFTAGHDSLEIINAGPNESLIRRIEYRWSGFQISPEEFNCKTVMDYLERVKLELGQNSAEYLQFESVIRMLAERP